MWPTGSNLKPVLHSTSQQANVCLNCMPPSHHLPQIMFGSSLRLACEVHPRQPPPTHGASSKHSTHHCMSTLSATQGWRTVVAGATKRPLRQSRCLFWQARALLPASTVACLASWRCSERTAGLPGRRRPLPVCLCCCCQSCWCCCCCWWWRWRKHCRMPWLTRGGRGTFPLQV